MSDLSRSEALLLARSLTAFTDAFRREGADPIAAQLRNCQPPEVTDAMAQLALLARSLEVRTKRIKLHHALLPLVKRILLEQRREIARAIDVPLQKAVDAQVIRMIRRELLSLEHLMTAPWFDETPAVRLPALTDYLSIRHAEAAMVDPPHLLPREYDEKFHILEAPSLFFPDLAYYRRRCRLRDAAVTVAFLDIDDFKAFNTRHTETKIDLVLLGPFMELVEAHVFGHGHAYRFGGDEYVILLPNASFDGAVPFLKTLQGRLAEASYVGIDRGPTVSIGIYVADADCPLIDREILQHANDAKNFAKTTEKGRIAGYYAKELQMLG